MNHSQHTIRLFCYIRFTCFLTFCFFLLVHVVLLALDSMGFVANMVSMVLYFMYVMKFDLAHSANTLTNFMGSTFLLSLIGGFISDTYLSRFTTCLIFGAVEILVTKIKLVILLLVLLLPMAPILIKLPTHIGFGADDNSSLFEGFAPKT